MEKNKDLKLRIIEYGKKLGFPIVRVTSARPFELWEGEVAKRKILDPTSADSWQRRKMTSDPRKLMPDARSIIVAVYPYVPYKCVFPKGYGTYSAYYRHYPLSRAAAIKLAGVLVEAGYEAVVDPPIPAKAAAYRTGAGFFGKNGLVYVPPYGSRIIIHTILTDAELGSDPPGERLSYCGECNRCICACPTGAILEGGTVLPSRCMRYYMLPTGFVPLEIRNKIDRRMLGCDICQAVCPMNRSSIIESETPSAEEVEPFEISAILSEWEKGLKSRLERIGNLIGKNYARARRILSAAVIVAGNIRDVSYVPLLAKTIKHPYSPVRGHSAWALGRIGDAASRGILERVLEDEKDPHVVEEIIWALQNMGNAN